MVGAQRRLWAKFAPLALLCFSVAPSSSQLQTQTRLGVLLDKARSAQTAEDYSSAATFYRRATAISPQTAELWSNLGVMEFLAGQLDPATASLQHAVKLKPDLFAALLFLGKAYLQQKQPALALPYLVHARTLQPEDIEVLQSLGKTYTRLHRQREAALAYRDATRASPQDAGAWLGLGSSSLELIDADGRSLAVTAPDSRWARALYADELLAQGRPVEATDTYRAVFTAATPVEETALARSLSHMLYNPSQFPLPAKSQLALQHLVDLTASASPPAAQGGREAAIACDGTNTGQSPSSLVARAACAFWANDYAESASQAEKALDQAPVNAEALYWSVKANERIAIDALARVDNLAPNSTANHDLVGDLYRFQHQPDNAISEYKRSLALDPHDPAALLGAAAVYLSASQYGEASVLAHQALADRPLDPQSNLLMAEILGAQNHEDEAGSYLEKCSNIAPEFQPRVHYLLGRAASKNGNSQEAISQFELALPGDEDGSIHFQLSRLYRKTGDLARAQKAEAEAKALVARREANAVIGLRETMATAP